MVPKRNEKHHNHHHHHNHHNHNHHNHHDNHHHHDNHASTNNAPCFPRGSAHIATSLVREDAVWNETVGEQKQKKDRGRDAAKKKNR